MTFVAIIITFIIIKFVYDTYLTNNTEAIYKNYNSTIYGIRTDGVYMFHQKGTSTWGEKFIITHILIFNTHGFVTYIEQDGKVNLKSGDIKNIVLEVSAAKDENNSCTKYLKKENKLDITFNGGKYPEKKTWLEKNLGAKIFSGKVDYNNLYLSYESIYFDETIGAVKSHKYFNNKKFTFFN